MRRVPLREYVKGKTGVSVAARFGKTAAAISYMLNSGRQIFVQSENGRKTLIEFKVLAEEVPSVAYKQDAAEHADALKDRRDRRVSGG